MDKPAVAHGRIINATLLVFWHSIPDLFQVLHVVLRHSPNTLEASDWKRWVSPESCNEVKSQSRRVYLDADSESKVYGFRLHQLRTGLLEVKPRASCHPTDCHSVDVWPCAAPTPTPAMRVLALINGPYFLPAENSQGDALPTRG
jgi:hypothetical protein